MTRRTHASRAGSPETVKRSARTASRLRRIVTWKRRVGVVFLLVLLPVTLVVAHDALRLNWTASIPRGLYTTEPFDPATARPGAVVMFCADPDASASVERFFLSGDDCVRHHPRPDQPARYAELAKPLAALPGDTVVVARSGVRVNGRLLPASEPLAESRLGEPVTAALGRHVLGAGEYWVHSSRVPYSLDSRYYGPVDAVRGVLHPVLVWDP